MSTLLTKRKAIDENSTEFTISKSIKNFIRTVASPSKKKQRINETKTSKKTHFITSSPKPPCKSPQKSFRTTFLTQDKENNIKNNNLRSPTNTLCTRSISEPGSIKRSHTLSSENMKTSGTELLFSPIFKKGIKRSYTSIGNINPQLESNNLIPKITFNDDTSESEELENSVPVFTLQTDETLSDLSDSESNVTFEIETLDDSFTIDNEENMLYNAITEVTNNPENFNYDLESLYFIKRIPPVPHKFAIRQPHLPPKRSDAPKITLVLDLDETLVHCDTSKLHNADYKFPIEFNNVVYNVWGNKRPFVDEFLKRVSQLFEVVVFTASQQVYADYILDELDNNGVIDHKLYRESCAYVSGNYIKDLNILGRDLSKVIIVDNAINSFSYQVNNGIPILSWYEDRTDRELEDLIPFLENLANVEDVRPYLKEAFNIQSQIELLK